MASANNIEITPIGTPNYGECCFNRLPCGICTRTNTMCPLANGVTITPTWTTTTNPSTISTTPTNATEG